MDAVSMALDLLAGIPTRPPAAATDLDWGVPLLATLTNAPNDQLAVTWASRHRAGTAHPGLFGHGLAGAVIGMHHAARLDPRLAPAAAGARAALRRWAAGPLAYQHHDNGVTYSNYDLILGPSGVLLTFMSLHDCEPAEIRSLVAYLAHMADTPDLPRLRITHDGGLPQRVWNIGHINLGLGHGAPGVLAALAASWPLLPPDLRHPTAAAIGHLADYLVRVQLHDEHGIIAWGYADMPTAPPARPRHAWCYGTPGIAWQLVLAGRILERTDLVAAGMTAMESVCHAWDDHLHLDTATTGDRLALCHGAAGILAVADTFAIHTGLPAAQSLASHLAALIEADLDAVNRWAAIDATTLSGATGILAVLLSREPQQRGWLRAVGLADAAAGAQR